jgi:hypothetical protein
MSGIGKTDLALKLAQRLAEDYNFDTWKHTIRLSTQRVFNHETYDRIKSVPAIG